MPLNDKDHQSLVRYLPEDLQLKQDVYLTEQDFLEALAIKVAYMLQYNNGVFFQLLYKMDVAELKLRAAMQQEDVPMAVSKLILERQLEKLESRQSNPSKKAQDKDLDW